MTLSLTKRVNYVPGERLDLNDKLAEDTLLDTTLGQHYQGLVSQSPDGRVFKGWTTTTGTGVNSGFNIPSEESFAIDRAGNVLIRDGTSGFLVTLSSNAVNYIYAHYEETTSDSDQRRKYESGSEIAITTDTRVTRTTDIHTTTSPYGAIAFADFAKTALISGTTRELIPLYAVRVDSGNNIDLIADWRPMWAPGIEDHTTNNYESEEADFPHSFTTTDAPTISITDIRTALVAITDRIKQLKGTNDWWEDARQTLDSVGDEWTRSGINIYRTGGFVGIGVDPVVQFHMESASPSIRLRDTDGDADTYLQIAAGASVSSFVHQDSGTSNVYLDAHSTGNLDCRIWFFRTCATTGNKQVRFSRGNTSDLSAVIGVDGLDSYFQIHGGQFGIGTASPTFTLDIQPPTGDASIMVSPQTAGASSFIEVGSLGSGPREAYIDLAGDDTYSNWGLRLIRENTGENADSKIRHQGTGALTLEAVQANGTIKLTFPGNEFLFEENPNGNPIFTIGSTTAGPEQPEMRLISNVDYATGGFRLYRENTGTNARTLMVHRGTGDLVLSTNESADLKVQIGSVGFVLEDRTSRDRISNITDRTLRIEQFLGVANLDLTSTHIETSSTLKLLGSSDNLIIGSAETWIFELDSSQPTIKFDADHFLRFDSSSRFRFLGGTAGNALIFSIASDGIVSEVSIDMQTRRVRDMGDPSLDQDATTKSYVDDRIETVRYTTNLLHNSGFEVMQWWQRGLTDAVLPALGSDFIIFDRWRGFKATGEFNNTTIEVSPSSTGGNIARINRDDQVSNSKHWFGQEIDRNLVPRLRSKPLRLRFTAKRGADYAATSNQLGIYVASSNSMTDPRGAVHNYVSGGTAGQYPTNHTTVLDTTVVLNLTETTYEVSIPTLGSSIEKLAIYFTYTPTSNGIVSNDWFEISQPMLVEGDVAVPWERAGITDMGDLEICKRFIEASWGNRLSETGYPSGAGFRTHNIVAGTVGTNVPFNIGAHPRYTTSKWEAGSFDIIFRYSTSSFTGIYIEYVVGGPGEQNAAAVNVTEEGFDVGAPGNANSYTVKPVYFDWRCEADISKAGVA